MVTQPVQYVLVITEIDTGVGVLALLDVQRSLIGSMNTPSFLQASLVSRRGGGEDGERGGRRGEGRGWGRVGNEGEPAKRTIKL